MRALLALPLLLGLAFAPAASAETQADAGSPPVDPFCFFEPILPETPLYYVVWSCTGGQLGVPEPIYALTGCQMGFPATNVECEPSPARLLEETLQCLVEEPVVPCVLQLVEALAG